MSNDFGTSKHEPQLSGEDRFWQMVNEPQLLLDMKGLENALGELQEQLDESQVELLEEIGGHLWRQVIMGLRQRISLVEAANATDDETRNFKVGQLADTLKNEYPVWLIRVAASTTTPPNVAEAAREVLHEFGLTAEELAEEAEGEAVLAGVGEPSSPILVVEEQPQEYIVSVPRGLQLAAAGEARHSLRDVQLRKDIHILRSAGEDGNLALMTAREAAHLKATMPDLLVEPNVLYKLIGHPLLDNFKSFDAPSVWGRKTVTVRVVDINNNQRPVPDVTVYLIVDPVKRSGYKGITNKQGECRLSIHASIHAAHKLCDLLLLPKAGYWNRSLNQIAITDEFETFVRPLFDAPGGAYDWGHQCCGGRGGLSDGAEIKIGIIDSGVCRDHPWLAPAKGHSFVDGPKKYPWHEDDLGHGTHVAGVIAARLASAGGSGCVGYVPQAQIHSYRVAKDKNEVSLLDISDAIDRAVTDGCDLINLSLGDNEYSDYLHGSIEAATENGVLCIAATGNDGGPVLYPAAYSRVVGISAFGKYRSYPDDSLHCANEPHQGNRPTAQRPDGEYYVAKFSNFGDEVNFCAPGVAITSTVPVDGFSAWDGTSMACPQVTGIAALALALNPSIFLAPRNPRRVTQLKQVLGRTAQPLGFGASYEGAGCLDVGRLP